MAELERKRAGSASRARGHFDLAIALGVLAALLLLSTNAVAKSHRVTDSDTTRVVVVPGVSLAFPPDWFACDGALNDQMHHAALPREIASVACRPVQGGFTPVHLFGLSQHKPASLVADRVPIQTLSSETLSQATPDQVAQISQLICSHMGELLLVDQKNVSECRGTSETVAGHVALVSRFALTDSTGRIVEMRAYRIPYDQGEASLQFEDPAATDSASQAAIDALLRSAQIEPGSYVAQNVALTPAPGVSLAIPSGWMACDDATNTLLGNTPDALGVRQKSCTDMTAEQKLAAFDPEPLVNVTVGVTYKSGKEITEAQLAEFTSDRLAEMTPQVCDSVTKPIRDQNRPVASCVLSVDQIAGHQALVVTLLAALSSDGDMTIQDRSRIYFVPYDQGFVSIEFVVPLASEALAQPIVDAVMKSVAIQ